MVQIANANLITKVRLVRRKLFSNQVEPNDIDLGVFYRLEDIVELGEDETKKLGNLLNQLSVEYDCDTYFCNTLDHLPPNAITENFNCQEKIMQNYWMGQFCFDRSRNPKGT
ncbi:hypothetical protein IPU53_08835 [Bacillus sp. SD088]|nr:hypothetical protein [Bacillus sp. SD088]MBO0993115.1 hypothetical protein [Bacillus sp. SD088]